MDREAGLTVDTLFVALTRPPMLLGVTYSALIVNLMLTMETFVLTRNLLWLLVCLPVHGLCVVLCAFEPRFFDLLQLWGRTRGVALVAGNVRHWRASAYSPLLLDLPDRHGRRRAAPECRIAGDRAAAETVETAR